MVKAAFFPRFGHKTKKRKRRLLYARQMDNRRALFVAQNLFRIILRMRVPKLVVFSAAVGDQLGMTALLDHRALVEHGDLVELGVDLRLGHAGSIAGCDEL